MMIKPLFAWVALAVLSLPAAARPPALLKDKEITESALIEALTPEETVRTRSIKVMRYEPNMVSPKVASASLLITFETNSAELTSQAKQSLNVVGRALKGDKLGEFKFTIEGHADPRGSSDLNQRLSQERAETVRRYLVQNQKVVEDRLTAIGKGDHELMNQENPTAPENRRVTIVTRIE